MKNYIFTFLLILGTLSLFAQTNPANYPGAGTSLNPYQIRTADDIENLATYIAQYSNAYLKMVNDIDLCGVDDLPIGTTTVEFRGHFDGNGYVLSNLKGDDKCLFKSLQTGGTIKNVTIINAEITTVLTSAPLAIITHNNSGIIENCYVQGTITASTIDNVAHGKGGIAGYNYSTGVIRNCFVNVEITGRHRIGGIVGKNHGVIENCYSTGKLTCTDLINGGITGHSDNMVRNCVNIIPVITGLPASGSMGTYRVYSYGGTGINNYSLNTTTINGSTVSSGTTSNYNGQNVTDAQLRTQSFWQALGYDFQNIWQMSPANSTYKGYPIFKWQSSCDYEIFTEADLHNLAAQVNAGDPKTGCTYTLMNDIRLSSPYIPIGTESSEFAGYFNGNGHTISNLNGNDMCLFRSLQTGASIKNLSITGAKITTDQTATPMGIFTLYNKGTIENCYAQGIVVGPAIDNIAHGKGGIAGYNFGTGVIRNCFVNVEISGRHRLGGIAGKNHGTIENCYSTGKLTGTDLINGGIAGHSDNLVRNCVNIMPVIRGLPSSGSMGTYRVYSYAGTGRNNYSLNTTTINGGLITNGTLSNYNGQNVTDAVLKTQSFWESIGYDFHCTWKMSNANGPSNGYPIFKWQTEFGRIGRDPVIPSSLANMQLFSDIYPNPTTGIVNIISPEETLDIKVYDMKGQLLFHTNKKTVDLSSYPSGMYIFNINGETAKIVKQ